MLWTAQIHEPPKLDALCLLRRKDTRLLSLTVTSNSQRQPAEKNAGHIWDNEFQFMQEMGVLEVGLSVTIFHFST